MLLMRKRLKATIPAKGNASHKVENGSGTAGVSDTSSKYKGPPKLKNSVVGPMPSTW